MAAFFYVIGLELKRELTIGELSNPRTILLPVAGAIGGALAPIGIYLLLAGTLDPRGWPVPVATDIAFAIAAITFGEINRWLVAALVGALLVYLFVVWRMERAGGPAAQMHAEESHTHDPAPQNLWLSAVDAIGGLAILVWGADLLVTGAIAAARLAGLSETVIGLTIVAIGTSLPELVATLMAALKGRSDVAFGNIVGSNIYNILGILGVTVLVNPIPIPADIGLVDWIALIGSVILLMIFAMTGKRLTRLEGFIMLPGYAAYVAYLLTP